VVFFDKYQELKTKVEDCNLIAQDAKIRSIAQIHSIEELNNKIKVIEAYNKIETEKTETAKIIKTEILEEVPPTEEQFRLNTEIINDEKSILAEEFQKAYPADWKERFLYYEEHKYDGGAANAFSNHGEVYFTKYPFYGQKPQSNNEQKTVEIKNSSNKTETIIIVEKPSVRQSSLPLSPISSGGFGEPSKVNGLPRTKYINGYFRKEVLM